MPLNYTQIEAARAKSKPYKLSDSDGLHLLVTDKGSKLWRFRYRFQSKQLMLSLGAYPEVSLASARQRRDDARKLLAQGIDPSEQRKADKIAAAIAAHNTFGAAAQDYLTKLKGEGRSAATIKKNKWLLEDLAAPLVKRPLTEIKPYEILTLLKAVEQAGKRETAHRLRGTKLHATI